MSLANYKVWLDGVLAGSPATPNLSLTGLTAGSTHQIEASSVDNLGNESRRSSILTATMPSGPVFTPNAGFTVTPRGSVFADKTAFTVTRSSGSFGSHGNFNKTGSLTWNGLPFLCFVAVDFESLTIGANVIGANLVGGLERSQQNGVNNAQWQVVSDAPTGRTRSARRANLTVRTDPLEMTLSSNPATIYHAFKMRPSAGASSGKYSRLFGTNGDFWLATGGSDLYIRGSDDDNYTAYGGYAGNSQFSTSGWNQTEWSFDQVNGKIWTWLNGVLQWKVPGGVVNDQQGTNTNTLPWTPGNIHPSGHTLNVCDERDNTGDYIDFTDIVVDLTLARFVIYDGTIGAGTRREFQIPLSNNGGWTTTSAELGMNWGEFTNLTGKRLGFYDTSENFTDIGHW